MKHSRILAATVAALLCAALIAGCGGPSKAQYEKDMQKVSKTAEKELDKLESGQPSPEDIEQAQKSLKTAADDIDDIEAPDEVAKLHDDLVEVLRDTEQLMGELAPLMIKATKDPSSLGEDEVKAMNDVTTKFGKIQKEMNRVSKGFTKKKYKIGFDSE